MDGYGKSCPPPGIDPRTVHSAASRNTDSAIPAHHISEVRGPCKVCETSAEGCHAKLRGLCGCNPAIKHLKVENPLSLPIVGTFALQDYMDKSKWCTYSPKYNKTFDWYKI